MHPRFFSYDRKRTLVCRGQHDSSRPKFSEPGTGEDIRNATNALIQNSNIPTEQKPSMGCNIKWESVYPGSLFLSVQSDQSISFLI